MKKRFLLLFLLLLMPIVHSKISITSNVKDIYNLGDSISSSISIMAENDLSGTLKLALECNNKSFDYYTLPVELLMNQQKNIDVPSKKISLLMMGDCFINAQLVSDTNEVIDNAKSKIFSVTDKIDVLFTLNKKTVIPGEKLILQGEIKPSFNDEAKDANLIVKIDDVPVDVELKGLKFNYEVVLGKTIKSKDHNVKVVLNDSFGNNGNKEDGFYVNPIQTKLEVNLNYTNFEPEEVVDIIPLLHDQAGDLIAENILIEIFSPKKKIFSENIIEGFKFTIPKHSIPGEYKIKAKSSKLKAQTSFNVEVARELGITQDGQILGITNIGNVNYYDTLIISFSNNESSFVKEEKIYLKPAQSFALDLGELSNTGTYNVKVLGNNFDNVEITGKSKFNSNILYWILAFIVIILLILIFLMKHSGKKYSKIKHERELKKGKEFIDKLRINKGPIKTNQGFRRSRFLQEPSEEKHNVKLKPRGQYFEIVANENPQGNEEYKQINEADEKTLFNMFD